MPLLNIPVLMPFGVAKALEGMIHSSLCDIDYHIFQVMHIATIRTDWCQRSLKITRSVNPNSYFVDRAHARFPQMDVWPSCCCFGATRDRTPLADLTVCISLRESSPPSARRPPSPLDFTYHGCPRFLRVPGFSGF